MRPPLDEQVVGGQAGRPDAEPGAPDDVLHLVRDALLPASLRDGLEVLLVPGRHELALVVVEPADAVAVEEHALLAIDGRHPGQQVDPAAQPGVGEGGVHCAVGVVQRQPELVVSIVGGEGDDLFGVRAGQRPLQVLDVVVRQRLLETEHTDAGGQPQQVPREVAQVRLVEVVDVEQQDARGVDVRAEVGGVEVTLDPHPSRPLVGPRVVQLHDVVVEEARRPAVEGERVETAILRNFRRTAVSSASRNSAKAAIEHVDHPLAAGAIVGDEVVDGRHETPGSNLTARR